MIPNRIWAVLICLLLFISTVLSADDTDVDILPLPVEPLVGSWSFSGMVKNESGDQYGYFFQMQKQGSAFHVKTALIDGQTNKMVLFYEENQIILNPASLNWHVGKSFIRYNPINDSWIFGVSLDNDKRFNFKVDMLKQVNNDNETLVLRPGVELQALQTSRVNGHLQIGTETKEQFVTGNNAWFGKVWFSKEQVSSHDISTTFCRLSDDNGFYSANLKEADATGAAVAGWRDALGNKVKMSQFISIKALTDDQCLLSVGLPKLNLKLMNTLKHDVNDTHFSIAGFSKDAPQSFCFVTEQSFAQIELAAVKSVVSG
ncbi:MAG: hypothetical protein PSV35_03115 [bacterium]|nr:hypothetical protein [bacterium]